MGLWYFQRLWVSIYHCTFFISNLILSLICYKNLQNKKEECSDYEIRFCCDKNQSQYSAVGNSLTYSEQDFGKDGFKIRSELKL